MTLVEVMVAMLILAMVMAAVFTSFITAERVTEVTVTNTQVNAIVQGYMEQILAMNYTSLNLSPAAGTAITGSYSTTSANLIPTQLNQATANTLVLSPLPVINPTTLATSVNSGAVPSGVYDNVVTYSINRTNDLTLHLWVWVQDLTPSGVTPIQQVLGITIVYMTQTSFGGKSRYAVGSVRDMRSLVPTD
jgi:type II secretory pathway pseudopilin PulG